MKKIILTLSVTLGLLISTTTFAQDDGAAGKDNTFADESVKDVATIAAIAAGGAILGLSTLSFVEVPGDNLKNIVVGGAIGVIIGVAVVAMSQASKSSTLYEGNAFVPSDFNTNARRKWHVSSNSSYKKIINAPSMNYSFSF